MNRRWSKGWFACALVLFATSAFAQVSAEVSEELLRKNGIWDQLGDVSAQTKLGFHAAMESGSNATSAKDRERVETIFAQAYEASRLRSSVLESVQARIRPDTVSALRAWYDSPVGKTITGLEMASSAAPTSPEERIKRGQDVFSHASDERKHLLKRVVEVTRAAEAITNILIASAEGIREGVLDANPNSAGPSLQEISASLEAKRPQIVQRYNDLTLLSLASMYESLSDKDLQRYVDFLASDAGASFNDACIQAMGHAMTESAKDFGRELQEAGLKRSS